MRILAVLISLVITCSFTAAAAAHGLSVEVAPGAYVVRAAYDDGTPIGNARIAVKDENESVVADGTADEQGVYCFYPPKPGIYEVTVRDGMGHRERMEITIDADAAAVFTSGPSGKATAGQVISGFGYLAGLGALAWWWLSRR